MSIIHLDIYILTKCTFDLIPSIVIMLGRDSIRCEVLRVGCDRWEP